MSEAQTFARPPVRRFLGLRISEINYTRLRRFKANRKAVICFWLLLGIFVVSQFSQIIANDRPLLVQYKGEYYVPVVKEYPETIFGGFLATTDYTDSFIAEEINANGWMIWPPVPYHYRRPATDISGPAPTPPDANHWLGTDDQGRDIIARLLYGIQINLLFGIIYVILSSTIGIAVGALQGYFGGLTDLFFQRVLEIYGSLPSFFIIILVSSVLAPNFWVLMGILVFFGWTGFVGVVRAEFLRARNFDYIRAAQALGVSDRKIMWRHVFPNAMIGPVTFLPFALAGSVTILAGLDFLGFGLPPGSPSLGEMVRQANANLQAEWIILSIFITLGLLTSLAVYIGEGVRNALDPRKPITLSDDS